MWRRQIKRVRTISYNNLQYSSSISTAYDRVGSRILKLLDTAPAPRLRALNQSFERKLTPLISRYSVLESKIVPKLSSSDFGRAFSAVRYKGVTSLIALNIAAFMTLNSHYMKSRSHVDGLQRSDRHFIASRYNLARGRIWCVPLSLFNHGDSLTHLMMNCFALSLVGPAIEVAFGASVLIGGFMFTGSVGAILEMMFGNHWCRGSSAGVSGVFGMSALAAPYQVLSIWGMLDVRAMSLLITLFGVETLLGLFGSHEPSMAHLAHSGGILAALPFMYYLKWCR